MKPLNFALPAMAAMTKAARYYEERGWPDSARMVRRLHKMLRDVPKFMLPYGGRILDTDHRRLLPDILRLPYPSIAVEYRADQQHAADAQDRIILATEVPADQIPVAPTVPSQLYDRGAILLRNTTYAPRFRQWQVSCTGIMVPASMVRVREFGLDQYMFVQGHWEKDENGEDLFVSVRLKANEPLIPAAKILPEAFDDLANRMGGAETVWSVWFCDLMLDLDALLNMLAALDCSNVHVDDGPSQKMENRFRKREHKPPLFEYKVLTIDVPHAQPMVEEGVVGEDGPKRASPRQHLRRGHPRHYHNKDGSVRLKVWIPAAVVGDATRGKITKDYTVTGGSSGPRAY